MDAQEFITYLSAEKKASPNTVKSYGDDLKQFFYFCDKELDIKTQDEINHHTIRNFIVFLSQQKLSARSINRKISTIRAYFKYMLRQGKAIKNPTTRVKNLKQSKKLSVPLSKNETEKLLSGELFEDSFWGRRDALIIEMFYTLGLRRQELCDLHFSSVDENLKLIKILGKGNKERLIPLLDISLKNIQKFKQECENEGFEQSYMFFDKKQKKLSGTFAYRIINSYLSLVSEKQKKSPHILRHTFATHLIENGADISSVKELLGHSSLASTEVYTHQSLAKLKDVYAKAFPKRK